MFKFFKIIFTLSFIFISPTFSSTYLLQEDAGVIRILSIDGGGIRGVVPGKILCEIEEHIIAPLKIAQVFDVVAGTSTGGIIALGLNVKREDGTEPLYTAKDILSIYEQHGCSIFPKKLDAFDTILGRSHSSEPLIQVLGTFYGNAGERGAHKLSDAYGQVIATTYNVRENRIHVFDSSQAQHSSAFNFYMQEAALATSAAPTYLPPAKIRNMNGEEFIFLDGGVIANNPCFYALKQALIKYPDATKFVILSIGTGEVPRDQVGDIESARSGLAWAPVAPNLMMQGASQTVDEVISFFRDHSKKEIEYLRVQTLLHASESIMDDASEANIGRLQGAASGTFRRYAQEIAALLKTDQNLPISRVTRRAWDNTDTLDFSSKRFGDREIMRITARLGSIASVERLNFSNNTLRIGRKVFFDPLVNIQKLDLSSNQLEDIEDYAFAEMHQLVNLKLMDNKIKRLTQHSLSGLSNLEVLYLNNNILEDIHDQSFSFLTRLKELNLGHNQLSDKRSSPEDRTRTPKGLKLGTLQPLVSLIRLDLSHNKLFNPDPRVFSGLSQLRDLNLLGNNLRTIDGRSFASFPLLNVGITECPSLGEITIFEQ